MKNPRTNLVIVLLTMAILVTLYQALQTKTETGQAKQANRKALALVLNDYLAKSRPNSGWWLPETPPPSPETARRLEQGLANIKIAMASTKDISPVTRKISDTFSNFFTSIYENGHSRVTSFETITPDDIRGVLEICFVSKHEYDKQPLPSRLYYRGDWRAIMVGGLNWPDPLWRAVLMHELGHALKHRQGKSSLPFTKDWLKEEVEMHELEGTVLNSQVSGKYFKKIDEVISRYKKCRAPDELLGQITVSDLLSLDESLGLAESGTDILGVTVAEHIVMLGFRFIDTYGGGMDSKIRHYRWCAIK